MCIGSDNKEGSHTFPEHLSHQIGLSGTFFSLKLTSNLSSEQRSTIAQIYEGTGSEIKVS